MNKPHITRAMLAARLHDPLEKTLILMRTREGHEGGTSAQLLSRFFPEGMPADIKAAVRRADHWAAAADRAAFPKHEADGRYPAWQNVRFVDQPVVIHPISGESFALDRLDADISAEAAKAIGKDHLEKLIHKSDDDRDDLRRTALAFWRFGPDLQATDTATGIRNLWEMLPADTRVPDHTIHDHLDLTAAFAASFAADPEGGPALLAVSLGPVQGFIAAARSTSDLWAGSHLLSRISWEAMKVICEEVGPEAILFPRLRGIPLVDLWLREACGLNATLFENERWTDRTTDANPLFAAALPNRFTALVPASRATELATTITARVRDWVHGQTEAAFRKLLEAAGEADTPELPAWAQIKTQLEGFPEVHWAAVPWSLARTDADGKVDTDDPNLAQAMQPFYAAGTDAPGYLGTQAWNLLSGNIKLEDGWFYKPNPGTLYPALYDLLERVLAAAKSTRSFAQTRQKGWRDSLTGEAEWLTTNRDHLRLAPGGRKDADTLWSRLGGRYGIKEGEHLDALGTLKRLWPTLFVDQLEGVLDDRVSRFVVSTHAMAVTGAIRTWLQAGTELPQSIRDAVHTSDAPRIALPRKLVAEIRRHPDADTLMRLPGWIESEETGDSADDNFATRVKEAFGQRGETYYGLLLMDGDRMGAWVAAGPEFTHPVNASFHPQIRHGGTNRFGGDQNFARYAKEKAAATPSRHMTISDALNQFAMHLAPYVVEERYAGRVLYAGGDDVMAMLPVGDLLPAMAALRAAYSGINPEAVGLDDPALEFERQANGFVLHRNHLLRLMGEQATASCGAVVAHHKAPLAAVLRAARAAESAAKNQGGRNAFCVTIVERSGGTFQVVAKWGAPLRALFSVSDWLRKTGTSRRAVYHSVELLRDLPPGNPGIVKALLTEQFVRKGGERGTVDAMIADLVAVAFDPTLRPGPDTPATDNATDTAQHYALDPALEWLAGALRVAEFLAREQRTGKPSSRPSTEDAA